MVQDKNHRFSFHTVKTFGTNHFFFQNKLMNNNQPVYIKVPKVHQIGTTVHVKESNSQTQSTSK